MIALNCPPPGSPVSNACFQQSVNHTYGTEFGFIGAVLNVIWSAVVAFVEFAAVVAGALALAAIAGFAVMWLLTGASPFRAVRRFWVDSWFARFVARILVLSYRGQDGAP